jgi:hypothetical protein
MMKYRFLFLAFLSIFALSSCNKDKIILNITAPAKGATFSVTDDIEVNVTATTHKGSITQVILFVDFLDTLYLVNKPYDFLIHKNTFKKDGVYYLSVMAYSTEGVQEGTTIDIIIKD